MKIKEVTTENFSTCLKDEYVMVDFYGEHCGACAATAPFLREVSNDMEFISFVQVNCTHEPKLAKEYDIKALPTFVYFHNGVEIYRREGGMDAQMIRDEITKLLYHR